MYWDGENQNYACDGKIQYGTWWQPVMTIVLINTLSTICLANTIKDIQSKYAGPGTFLMFFGIFLQISANILLVLTAVKDPATIPTRVSVNIFNFADILFSVQRFLKHAFKRKQDNIAEVDRQKYLDVVNGRLTKIKYCSSCHIYRPPRTVHCGACGCCIERLDHHCPWIGTCVGKRNYKYFIMFMWSLFLICLFAIATCSGHIANREAFGSKLEDNQRGISAAQVGSIVILTITCGLSIFVFFLFGYH